MRLDLPLAVRLAVLVVLAVFGAGCLAATEVGAGMAREKVFAYMMEQPDYRKAVEDGSLIRYHYEPGSDRVVATVDVSFDDTAYHLVLGDSNSVESATRNGAPVFMSSPASTASPAGYDEYYRGGRKVEA